MKTLVKGHSRGCAVCLHQEEMSIMSSFGDAECLANQSVEDLSSADSRGQNKPHARSGLVPKAALIRVGQETRCTS